MKTFLFLIFACLAFTSLNAELIGTIEYQLPNDGKEWEVKNKLHGEKGTTIIYVPKSADAGGAMEFFGVNSNNLFSSINDSDAIKTSLSKIFSHSEIDFKILERNSDSITYEWSASEGGFKQQHGWGRAFTTNEGTVVLSYQTEDIPNIHQAREIWLTALRQARKQQ